MTNACQPAGSAVGEGMSCAPSATPTVENSAAHSYLKIPVPPEVTEPLSAVPPGRALFSGARE